MRDETDDRLCLVSDRTKEERNGDEKRRPKASFYMVCSALFGTISLMGLFFGFFMRGSVGALIADGEPILRGSYLGVIVEVLRGSIALPKAQGAELADLLPVLLYFMIFVLAAGVLLSLALSVLTCVKAGSARLLCTANGFLTLFVYGTLCVGGVLLGSLRQELYSWRQADLPSLTAVLLAFAVFAAMAVVRRGAGGGLDALLLLVNALSVCAFVFPQTPLLSDFNAITSFGTGIAKHILMTVLLLVTAVNLVLSVLRLDRPHRRTADIVRFGIQLAAALALAATYLADGGITDFFTAQPFASLFLLLPPLCALLLSAFARVLQKGKDEKTPVRPLPSDSPPADSLAEKESGQSGEPEQTAPPAPAAQAGP